VNSCSIAAGNSPRFLEQTPLPVDFLRRLKQQVGQGRMQPLPGHEFHGRTDQNDILGWEILAEINRTLGQFRLVELGIPPNVGVGLGERVQLDVRRRMRVRRVCSGGRISHEEDGVNFPFQEPGRRRLGIQIQEDRLAVGDAVLP